MKFYPHHIGDFNNATRHLTRVERSLYRDLIDVYYDTESPIPANDFDRLCRKVMATTDEETKALQYVLEEFFILSGALFIHERCELELDKYRANTSQKAKAGKASAEARKKKREHMLNVCSTDEQQTKNQEPRTNNHKPIKEKIAFSLFWDQWPQKKSKSTAERAWNKLSNDDQQKAIDATLNHQKTKQWKEGFIPHASTFLNQRRFDDELTEADYEENGRHANTSTGQPKRSISERFGIDPRQFITSGKGRK